MRAVIKARDFGTVWYQRTDNFKSISQMGEQVGDWIMGEYAERGDPGKGEALAGSVNCYYKDLYHHLLDHRGDCRVAKAMIFPR